MPPGKLDILVGRLEDVVTRLEALLHSAGASSSIERKEQAVELEKVIKQLKKEKWEVEEAYE